jgi:hypothetical protein
MSITSMSEHGTITPDIATSGHYYPATNMAAVQGAYDNVFGTLDTRLQDIYTVS